MSAIADHVLVQLTIDSVGLTRQGFGVQMILSHTATFPERIRYYTSLAGVTVDFPTTTSAEYLAAAAAFAQSPKPPRIAIGRAAGTVTQRYDVAIGTVSAGTTYIVNVKGKGVTSTTVSYTALTDLTFVDGDVTTGTDTIAEAAHGMTTGEGPYRVSNSGGALPTGLAVDTNYWIIAPTAGTYKFASSKANALALTAVDITAAAGGGTHTLRRAQNDVIIAELVQGINAVTGVNFAAVQTVGAGETDTLRATGSAVNNWFSLEVPIALVCGGMMTLTQSHAAPSDITLATDLAAILLADQGWYCLITLYNSSLYIQDAAAWAESNGRIYVPDSCDSATGTTALSGGTDVGSVLFGLGDTRSMGCYYPSPAAMLAAREMGRWLPTDPGAATTKFKTLNGIAGLALTDTFKANLRAKRMNTYEQALADRAFFWEGTVFSTVYKFLDITRNADWLGDEASKALIGVLVGADIVPYTPEGIVLMEGALRGVGTLATRRKVLTTVPPPVVTAPDIASVSSTDKENRNLRDLKLSGTFAGAIHSAIPVTAVLTF